MAKGLSRPSPGLVRCCQRVWVSASTLHIWVNDLACLPCIPTYVEVRSHGGREENASPFREFQGLVDIKSPVVDGTGQTMTWSSPPGAFFRFQPQPEDAMAAYRR